MPRLGLGLGLTRSSMLDPLAPLKKCGMIQYSKGSTNGVLIDKIGKSTRDAVQGRTLVGNGQTYGTFTWTQASALWDVEFEVNVTSSTDQVLFDCRKDGGVGYAFFNSSNQLSTSSGSISIEGNKYIVSDITLDFTTLVLNANSVFILKFNENLLSLKMTNKSTGIEYNLNIEERQSTGILSLNGSDGTKILGQQYLSPATATVVNNTVESAFDRLGGSIAKALGDNKLNELEQGSLSSATGLPVSSSNRLRSSKYSLIEDVSDIVMKATNAKNAELLEIIIMQYKSDHTYIGTTGWQSNPLTISVDSEMKYVKVIIKFSSGSVIVPTDVTDAMLNTGSVALPYSAYLGYTMNQAGTIYFDDGTPIPCGTDGLIMGYVNGVRVAPEHSGRVRYNRVVCDVSGTPTGGEITPTGYIKLADKYNGITKYDTNRIQTELDGTGKVLPIADMLHITNNQMFATEDKKDIGFFDKELTGDCKNKAITFFKQGEQLTDQNGDLLFDAQGNALFTFKPWVTN